MACEICGSSVCAKAFHSIDEQNDFDSIADKIKDRMRNYLIHRIERLQTEEIEDVVMVSIDEVIEIINDYD